MSEPFSVGQGRRRKATRREEAAGQSLVADRLQWSVRHVDQVRVKAGRVRERQGWNSGSEQGKALWRDRHVDCRRQGRRVRRPVGTGREDANDPQGEEGGVRPFRGGRRQAPPSLCPEFVDMTENCSRLDSIAASSTALVVIEQHRAAFEALQKQVELTDTSDGDEIDLVTEHLELEHLEAAVEEVAIAMTTMPLRSVHDVVALLAYIDEFSRARKSGHLLWPEVASLDGEQLPWPFAVLEHIRRSLECIFPYPAMNGNLTD